MSKADVHLDKEELKRPDVFLQTMEKSLSTLEQYRSVVIGAVVLFIVAGLVFITMDFMGRRSDAKASEELYKVEATYNKLKEDFDRAKFEALSPMPKDAKDPKAEADKPKAASGDLQADYGTVVQELENVATKNAKSPAGAQAAILVSDLYIEYKQPEKAVDVLSKVAPHVDSNSLLYGLSYMQLGNAHSAKGDCAQAVISFQKVLDSKDIGYLHPDALLKSGICHESLNQADKARESYRRIVEDFGDTAAAQSARSFLRALEAKPGSSSSEAKPGSSSSEAKTNTASAAG